jgi:hypothetical protein
VTHLDHSISFIDHQKPQSLEIQHCTLFAEKFVKATRCCDDYVWPVGQQPQLLLPRQPTNDVGDEQLIFDIDGFDVLFDLQGKLSCGCQNQATQRVGLFQHSFLLEIEQFGDYGDREC